MNPALANLIIVVIQLAMQVIPILVPPCQLIMKLINKGSVDLTPEELVAINDAQNLAHQALQEQIAKDIAEDTISDTAVAGTVETGGTNG